MGIEGWWREERESREVHRVKAACKGQWAYIPLAVQTGFVSTESFPVTETRIWSEIPLTSVALYVSTFFFHS